MKLTLKLAGITRNQTYVRSTKYPRPRRVRHFRIGIESNSSEKFRITLNHSYAGKQIERMRTRETESK